MKKPELPNQMNEYFANAYNSGNIENLIALYKHNAKSVTKEGNILTGISQIKEDLEKLLQIGGKMISTNKFCVEHDNFALLGADWKIETVDADQNKISISATSSEIVEKQEDGSWIYVVDNPFSCDFKIEK